MGFDKDIAALLTHHGKTAEHAKKCLDTAKSVLHSFNVDEHYVSEAYKDELSKAMENLRLQEERLKQLG